MGSFLLQEEDENPEIPLDDSEDDTKLNEEEKEEDDDGNEDNWREEE